MWCNLKAGTHFLQSPQPPCEFLSSNSGLVRKPWPSRRAGCGWTAVWAWQVWGVHVLPDQGTCHSSLKTYKKHPGESLWLLVLIQAAFWSHLKPWHPPFRSLPPCQQGPEAAAACSPTWLFHASWMPLGWALRAEKSQSPCLQWQHHRSSWSPGIVTAGKTLWLRSSPAGCVIGFSWSWTGTQKIWKKIPCSYLHILI